MLKINKQGQPKALYNYKAAGNTKYDGPDFGPVKDSIREQLVDEQKGLCAYCMRRIKPDANSMKVEHWHPQSAFQESQLEWGNLLGACTGILANHQNDQSPKNQCCDTRKGDLLISFNPASNPNVETMIQYLGDGEIVSSDENFMKEMEETLNLNHDLLKGNREKAIDAYIASVSQDGVRTAKEIQKKIDSILAENPMQEYAGVALYLLRKRLARVPK